MPDKRKKVTFVKTKEVKEGDFKGLKKGVKSKKMSEKRAQKKQAKGQGFISKVYGSNPIEMSPYKMESAGQEKYNLLHDNPVAKHASGGSWMSKHSQSALHMGHSPAEMGHESPAKNLGHGMDDMNPEKGAHRKYHLKQRMSKKSKDSVAEMKYPSPAGKHCM